ARTGGTPRLQVARLKGRDDVRRVGNEWLRSEPLRLCGKGRVQVSGKSNLYVDVGRLPSVPGRDELPVAKRHASPVAVVSYDLETSLIRDRTDHHGRVVWQVGRIHKRGF